MPDDDINVVYSAFDAEAQKWRDLAAVMSTSYGRAGALWLNGSAFFCGNPATAYVLSEAYNGIHDLVKTLLTDAEEEFYQLADALIIARDLYDESDRTSAAAFVKIYGE